MSCKGCKSTSVSNAWPAEPGQLRTLRTSEIRGLKHPVGVVCCRSLANNGCQLGQGGGSWELPDLPDKVLRDLNQWVAATSLPQIPLP